MGADVARANPRCPTCGAGVDAVPPRYVVGTVDAAEDGAMVAPFAPAIDGPRPAWESMPNGLHEMWWALDVYKNGERELYAIVKERDDRSTATWAVSAQGDGDDHAAIAEGVAASVDAAQLAAESALRAIVRGINAAIGAVPGEVIAAAREVMRLDGAMTPGPWVVDDDEPHDVHGPLSRFDLRYRVAAFDSRIDARSVVGIRIEAPLLAAWVIAQAEGRGE